MIMEKCHVVSLKKMDGLSEKVVGVISVPECLKKKVLDYNGNVVDKAKIKVYRTKICRYGQRCFSQKCVFVYDVERTVNQEMLSEEM